MAGVQINMPDKTIFETDIKILIAHINYGGHLANDAVLSICQEARIRFLESLGYTELDIGEGRATIMADAAIRFLSEAYRGQEIAVSIGVDNISRCSFRLYYLLNNKQSGKAIAKVSTGIVSFDYKQKKVVSLPAPFKKQLLGTQ